MADPLAALALFAPHEAPMDSSPTETVAEPPPSIPPPPGVIMRQWAERQLTCAGGATSNPRAWTPSSACTTPGAASRCARSGATTPPSLATWTRSQSASCAPRIKKLRHTFLYHICFLCSLASHPYPASLLPCFRGDNKCLNTLFSDFASFRDDNPCLKSLSCSASAEHLIFQNP